MTDRARKKTDQELKKLEREIYELYATSSSELYEKWHKYMQSHKKKLDSAYDTLQDAKKSGDRDAIKAAQEEYERTFKNVTLNDERYKAMINETTAKMAHVNEVALGYVNDETPKVYTLNYNAFSDEKIDGYDFTLVNERAVKNLIESDKIELPPKKVDIPKDQRWNAKNLNSQLMQGILQGENISKIAKRLQNVTDMNRNSAIRNARTMVTGAENKGRQDSFKKAESDGVIMKRRWVATHDERTRAWHSDLDGQEVGLDEPWENDYGEIMYPGDPTADPANVYNCRCSIRAIVKGFAWNQEKSEEEESVNKESEVQMNRRGQIDVPDRFEQILYETNMRELSAYDKFRVDKIVEETGYDRTTARNAKKSLDDYFENYYPKWKTHSETAKDISKIDTVLSDMTAYDGTIYRGLHFDTKEKFDEFAKAELGSTLSTNTITSWSSEKSVAERYASPQNYHIILECIDNKSSVAVQHLSRFGKAEAEVLGKSTTNWEIVNKVEDGDILRIIVKEV